VSKRKGSRAELRCIRILEAAGYVCTKAGGSLGLFDIIAIGARDVRCIQVKCGKRPYLAPLEREAIGLLAVPENCSKELWKLPDYCRQPLIEIL
jgi:Holliday junction resolvase